MKYFVIIPDVENFTQIITSDLEEVKAGEFKCWQIFRPEQKLETWQSPMVEWAYDIGETEVDYPVPDIAHFSPGVLALSPKALAILKPCLPDYTELLPLPIDGSVWQLLHFPTHQDAFNKDLSEFDPLPSGRPGIMHKLALNEDGIDRSSVFRVKGLMSCFASEADDGFMERIKSHGLTGIKFKEVEACQGVV